MDQTPDDDAWLIALGAIVSDGGEVDWPAAEQRAVTREQQDLVRQLRGLAGIVQAHRTVDGTAATEAADGRSQSAPAASQWRHLVIFERIGSGAFGSVYRAWDPRLDREVAVKLLLRESMGAAPLDEARHLARVRHPNVITVYGADDDGGAAGIWMEYIDGRTLAQLVRERGPMSAREVIGIALDLCGALSAIHASGLVHRDIKAQNVMRQVGGRIVLMDFSGAHAVRSADAAAGLSGTPLYMAPELFEGHPASAATDLYSLGVLLFFLLTGQLPVEGSSIEHVKQAHATGERRRLRDTRADVPDGLVRVIERATAAEPARRFRTVGEFEHALATVSGTQPAPSAGADWRSRPAMRLTLVAAAALTLLAVGALGATRWRSVTPAPAVVARFTIGPPYVSGSWPRVSPDGRYVVFGAIVEGRTRFWIHSIDQAAGRPLMATTATETPFWSPDSNTLCFFEEDRLKKIRVAGGDPQVLAEAPAARGGDWSGDSIIFGRDNGIYRVPASGGPAEQLTSLDASQGENQHGWPKFLPDGRRFLFVIRSSRSERTGLYLGFVDKRAAVRLMPAYSRTTYADGHLLYVRDGSLVAHPFDERSASLRGEPVTLAQRVNYHSRSDAAFDVSGSGVLIFNLAAAMPSTRLILHDRRGRELYPLTAEGSYGRPRFSPDGQRIAAEKFDRDDNNSEIWVYGVGSGSAVRLTRHPAHDVSPVWSPDGRRIAFSSNRGGVYNIFVKPVDGIEEERPLLSAPGDKFVESWSPDGKFLTATVLRSGLWTMPIGAGAAQKQVRAGERASVWQSEFSPDGRWLAYMSTESGKPQVYVEPFPANGSRWQVSPDGGAEPHWASDSNELLYLNSDGVLTSVRRNDPGWTPSRPQHIVPLHVPDIAGVGDYAISPDGRLLVVNTFVSDPLIPPIEVVVNWTHWMTGR